MDSFGSATLVLDGPNGGVKSELTGARVSMGRTRENEIVVADPAASSKHCEIFAKDGVLYLHDLGSSNGTFVNGTRVDTVPLYDGDIVRIGQSQGRIEVLTLEGKPFRLKAARGPVFAVAVVVVVLLAAGGGALYRYVQHKNAERDQFMEYEQQAHKLLTESSPCLVVSSLQLDFLSKRDAEALQVATGNKGELTPEQRDKDAAILAGSKQRDTQAAEVLKKLRALADERHQGREGLKAFDGRFTDETFRAAVLAVDQVIAQQGRITDEFIQGWQEYSASVKETNTLLEALLSAPAQPAADAATASSHPEAGSPPPVGAPGRADVAAKLDARLAKKLQTPAQLADTCEHSYKETPQEGMAQLSRIAL
jgi:predicted component of type VI protein secretion system